MKFDNETLKSKNSARKITISTPIKNSSKISKIGAPARRSNRLREHSLRSQNETIEKPRNENLESDQVNFKPRNSVYENNENMLSFSANFTSLSPDKLKTAIKYAKGLNDTSSVRILTSYAVQNKLFRRVPDFEVLDFQKHMITSESNKFTEAVIEMPYITVALSIIDQTYDQHYDKNSNYENQVLVYLKIRLLIS